MSVPTGINSQTQANQLFIDLVGAANAELPDIDLFDEAHSVPWDSNSDVLKPVEKLETADLVEAFETVMASVGDQLQKEFDANRITGAKYAETYLALTQGTLGATVQFLLGKDQAYWMSAKTQADAITSNNQNEVARLQAIMARAQFALTKLKLATEDSTFGISEYNRETMLPAQKQMVDEQKEAQRAQTMSTRSDGSTPVAGLSGKQMELYSQQKQSYKDDTRIKATKVFSDLWVTQFTVDDATPRVPAISSFDATGVGSSTTNSYKLNKIFEAMRRTAIGDFDGDGTEEGLSESGL